MIDFLRALRTHSGYTQRMLSFIPALVVSEAFYKFHSFTLELGACLGTWLVFDLVSEWVAGAPTTGAPHRAAGSDVEQPGREGVRP